jgi:hypothetical protein
MRTPQPPRRNRSAVLVVEKPLRPLRRRPLIGNAADSNRSDPPEDMIFRRVSVFLQYLWRTRARPTTTSGSFKPSASMASRSHAVVLGALRQPLDFVRATREVIMKIEAFLALECCPVGRGPAKLRRSRPTLDFDGADAAHKLAILAQIAFGVSVPSRAMSARPWIASTRCALLASEGFSTR